MATKSQTNHLMYGVGGAPLELRVSKPRPSLSIGEESFHDRNGKQSKSFLNPYAYAGIQLTPGQQRTVAPVRTGVTPQLSGHKRKRGSTNATLPIGSAQKKPRTSVASTSTAGGSNADSGVERLLLGRHITSEAAKTSKLSPNTTDNQLEHFLEGRELSADWHSGDTDEMALRPRTTGKQRDEDRGPDDCVIDLGKPKLGRRGRTPSGSTSFKPIRDRVRQFEQGPVVPLSHRDQCTQPPRAGKIKDMRPKTLSNTTTSKPRLQRKGVFDDQYVLPHFTSTPASKADSSQKPRHRRDPGGEIIIKSRIPIELWYLGVERKVPAFEEEDTEAFLQWEATGETRKLIVTTKTKKGFETFQIDISGLELWANIKEGRGALFVLKVKSPFYRQHKQRGSFVDSEDFYGRAMLFRFSEEDWERENHSLGAFLINLKEHGAHGKKPMKEHENLFKNRAVEARRRKPASPPSFGSPAPEPSTSTLADMEASPLPPARLSPKKKPPRERVATTTRSTRQSSSTIRRENTVRKELEEVILAYPFTGTGGVEVTKGDLNRLKPGEYLNDTLVEFSLKHWLHELKMTNSKLAEEIHVFSTFFYKRLKTGSQQQGYANVRKWTSKVDIFKKKYLIVPINEHVHWYLAIILFPGNTITSAQRPVLAPRRSGRYNKPHAVTMSSRSPVFVPGTPSVSSPATSSVLLPPESDLGPGSADEMERPKHRRRRSMNIDDKPNDIPMKPIEPEGSVEEPDTPRATPQDINGDSTEPVDSVMQDVEDLQSLDPIDRTWILTFDSLGGGHPTAIKALHAYLKLEALDKKGFHIGDKPPIHGKKVPTPEQPNSCDCGVYVGQVVETIFKSPAEFWQLTFSKVQKNRLTENHSLWDIKRFKEKRNELYSLITKLSEQWKEDRSIIAAAPLPNSSTPPTSETAVKQDQDIPPHTYSKRKARPAEPTEVCDEDEDVIILEGPAAKRQQKSARQKAVSTPGKSIGNAALRLRGA